MIGLVTDSTSQIPAELCARYDVEVVAIPVMVDGRSYLEGVDLDADGFYDLFASGTIPAVSTSQPSPGQFVAAYRRLAAAGADEILSVHVGESLSGTLNSARIARDEVDIPVRLVDSNTVSFGITCCLWEAAEAIAGGAGMEAAAVIAESTAARVRSVFIIQALDFVLKGGRGAGCDLRLSDDVPVLKTTGPHISQTATGRGVEELCDLMAAEMHADGAPIRAAVCLADVDAKPFADGLEERLADRTDVVDLVRYRVGPSVGVHTGPGTAGGFWYPIDRQGAR
ncbi:MAG: DegV family protein [Acidimicrobiia bacterium]|nr:DegV family protein [Acidimicrobiia bacterium]